MAQNGPHGNQGAAASDDGHRAPPPTTTTVAFSLTSAAGPYGNGGSSKGNTVTMDAGAGLGKNLIPDLNMEDRDSAGGSSKDKPRSEVEAVVEVPAADADADAVAGNGKSVAAAGGGDLNITIILERERRRRMKDLFRALQDLMPHVPHKTDKVTLLGEAIRYIKALEAKAAMLAKQALARQAAAVRGEASSSSFSLTPPVPQAAQGMVPPAAPAVAAPPIRFKTWSAPNVVLTVANDNAYISVCAPQRHNTLTTVMSVLDNHGIDVVTAHISSDNTRTMFMIFAHVTGIEGANRSSEEVFQTAVSEAMLRLSSNT